MATTLLCRAKKHEGLTLHDPATVMLWESFILSLAHILFIYEIINSYSIELSHLKYNYLREAQCTGCRIHCISSMKQSG